MLWTQFWFVLPISSGWMRWNLFLAFVPWILSIWLFRWAWSRSPLWWVGVLVFLAFLPNAPYVLTDLIHLVQEIQSTESLLVNTLVTIPKYSLFVVLGFGAYVLSLVNVGLYLKAQGLAQWVLPMELLLHALSAIGINLGRFDRFNSWDLMMHPKQVVATTMQNLAEPRSLWMMTIGTLIITVLYWLSKQIVLALILRYQYLTSEAFKMEND